jgi:hypothetical protein
MINSTSSTPKTLRAGSASFAVATAVVGSVLSGAVAAPTAHADPILDPIIAEVNASRSHSTCPPLNYSPQLEADAQAYARRPKGDTAMPGGYPGQLHGIQADGDPTSKAITNMMAVANDFIKDCKWKDFGAGMVRNDDESSVAVVLGQGAPAPANNPPPRLLCSIGGYAPPGQTCPEAPANNPPPAANTAPPVTDAIQANFGQPTLTSIPLTVTNTSSLAASCHYVAVPGQNVFGIQNTTRDFSVAANATHTETFNGHATGTTYTVTISCRDASGKQTAELGHQNLTVTW